MIGIFSVRLCVSGVRTFHRAGKSLETWVLAAIYLSLVIACLAQPEGSGNFFGERFHLEGIFTVFLLAGRGAALLVERWQLSRAATAFVLVLLTVLQLNQQAATAITVARRGEPYRKIRTATARSGIVFLHDSRGFCQAFQSEPGGLASRSPYFSG